MNYGFWSLIPILVIIALALVTKDTFISIFAGLVVGFLMIAKGNPHIAFTTFLEELYKVMTDETTVWVLLVCGLFGSLLMLMQEAGGVLGFSNLSEKLLKTRKRSLLGTWILGIIIFVDDYLNCLAVGAAVRSITDRFKVSREMLAYIVNSTGVTVCAILPISTWGAFMSTQMVKANMNEGLSAMAAYLRAVPFVLYGWIAVFLVPLFSLGILPLFGPMKRVEQRAITTGEVLSKTAKENLVELPPDERRFEGKKCRAYNFLIPILMVAVLTITTEDILIGLFAALALCFVLYLVQGLMTIKEYFKHVMAGLTDMFPMLVIIILSYTLIGVNKQLGLIDYVIGVALKTVPASLLPVIIFVVIGLLSFASGSFWGLAIIAFPIVGPLASALGVNTFLAAGALISAVALGGHICLYSDTVILTSASTQVPPAEYFTTSGPLILVPFILSALGFILMGFLF